MFTQLCVCVCVYVACAHMITVPSLTVQMRRSEDSLQRSVLSFYSVGFGDPLRSSVLAASPLPTKPSHQFIRDLFIYLFYLIKIIEKSSKTRPVLVVNRIPLPSGAGIKISSVIVLEVQGAYGKTRKKSSGLKKSTQCIMIVTICNIYTFLYLKI